jgi:Fur family ferric uptake transcriptional regulator
MERATESVRERLSKRDFRLTAQREVILNILINNQDAHLSADDIYMATKDIEPGIGLATVYRTLDLFEQLKVVHRLEVGDGGSRYEFRQDPREHYHHHVICRDCGEIEEVSEDSLDKLEQAVAEKSGFEITDHSLRFYGYCKKCKHKHCS